MSHSLEHFNAKQLKKLLLNVNMYLSEDGVFVCEVPNEGCRNNIFKKIDHAPHTCFFSQESLEKILKDCRFDIQFINTVGQPINFQENRSESKLRSWLKVNLRKIHFIKNPLEFVKFIFRYLEAVLNYLWSNHALILVRSSDYQYGANRNKIRVCAKKGGS